MAGITFTFMVAMLALNAAAWFQYTASVQNSGWNFGLSVRLLDTLKVTARELTWWQLLGAVLISSVPLLALINGLRHLRALFREYAMGAYFSSQAAVHLGKTGCAVAWWVLLETLCEPILSVWLTLLRGTGQRIVSLSFDNSDIVALFISASIAVIARILGRAAELYEENRQFV
ncbi:DUF2975 domain-containing protein [Bordetella genomosp. 9]|uniref:DUF2975 domain-containing protein n=2 Tax=Bordetella genomosp. 9 TaxID=1416803 RepID=A0A1W6Z5K7_9BORD|nr:DUF2975 domain-containing protein [Bordetella genomosp. 9]